MNRPDNLVDVAAAESQRASTAWEHLWSATVAQLPRVVTVAEVAAWRRQLLAAGEQWPTGCYIPSDRLAEFAPFVALALTPRRRHVAELVAGLAAWRRAPATVLVHPRWADRRIQDPTPLHDRNSPRWAWWTPMLQGRGSGMFVWNDRRSIVGVVYPDGSKVAGVLARLARHVVTTTNVERIPSANTVGVAVAVGFTTPAA